MKHIYGLITLALALCLSTTVYTQGNLGINNPDPQETLDIHEGQPGDTRTAIKIHTPSVQDTAAIILSTGDSPSNYAKYYIGTSGKRMFISSKSNTGTIDTIMHIDENGDVFLRNLSVAGAGQVMSDEEGRLYSTEPPSGGGGGGGGPGIAAVAGVDVVGDYTELEIDFSQNFSYLNSGSNGFILVPFDVPEDATLNSITYYLFDNSSSITLKGQLMERHFQNPSAQAIAGYTALTAGGANLSVQAITKSGSFQVDKSIHHYFLKISIQSGSWPGNGYAGFFGAKIHYSVP